MYPFLDVKYSVCNRNISDTSRNEDDEYDNDINTDTTEPVPRGSKDCITARLAALDVAKVSDRKAVHILTATAEAFGVDLNSLILNRNSVRNARRKYRELAFTTQFQILARK